MHLPKQYYLRCVKSISLESWTWSLVVTTGPDPGKRWGHSAATVMHIGAGTIIYTGGREGSKPLGLDSVHALTVSTVCILKYFILTLLIET